MAGNAKWADYSVAVDVRFVTDAPAAIMGRIDSADVFQDGNARWPSGYVLRLKPDGAWELLSAEFKKPVVTLATGTARFDSSQWHRLELRFHGKQIMAALDGAPLTTVEDSTHGHGMFALGTEWEHVQFDGSPARYLEQIRLPATFAPGHEELSAIAPAKDRKRVESIMVSAPAWRRQGNPMAAPISVPAASRGTE